MGASKWVLPLGRELGNTLEPPPVAHEPLGHTPDRIQRETLEALEKMRASLKQSCEQLDHAQNLAQETVWGARETADRVDDALAKFRETLDPFTDDLSWRLVQH